MSREDQAARWRYTSSNADDEPLYNIGVVSRMTGVPIATLRVWERRYGFPRTSRTDGGHRIYSEREVGRLRWVKARVEEGMQAGKAVRALEVTEAQGRFPDPPQLGSTIGQAATSGTALDAFHRRLLDVLLRNDLAAANQVIGEVLGVFSIDELITGVLQPALVDIGEAWVGGRATVATEHLASQFIRERLLLWMPTGPAAYPVRSTVLACAPDEWHDLSLLMFGVMLRRRRWPVAFLGQSVPLEDLAALVRDTHPPAVVMVAMREHPARAMQAWPNAMPETAKSGRPVFCFAGRAFTQDDALRESTLGTYLGPSLAGGVDRLDRVLRDVTGVM